MCLKGVIDTTEAGKTPLNSRLMSVQAVVSALHQNNAGIMTSAASNPFAEKDISAIF